MSKIKTGDLVVAKGRVGEVRRLFDSKGAKRALVYFPYEHETDSMILSGYEQNQDTSGLRVAAAFEKKDFLGRQKALRRGSGMKVSKTLRYVLVDPSVNANKFWEIEGASGEGSNWTVRTHWGRVGHAAQSKTHRFKSADAARGFAEKIIAEKEKKGYGLAGEHGKPTKKAAKKASKKASGKGALCGDCGCSPGELHRPGCDIEGCPKCGRQLLSCKHGEAILDDPDAYKRKPWSGSYGKPSRKPKGKMSLKKLTSAEVNWLAQHGWSSAQIKAMSLPEARKFIKAGKRKEPGAETEKAGSNAEYRELLLKTGFVALVKPNGDAGLSAICDRVMRLGENNDVAKKMLSLGRFSDGQRAILLIPNDKACAREFCLGISGARHTMREAEASKGIGLWMVEAVRAACKRFRLDEWKMWRAGEDRVGHDAKAF